MPSCRIKRYLGLPSAEVVCTGHKESKLKAEASMAELQARRWSQKRARVALSQAVANSDSGAPCGSLPREVGFKTASPEAPLRAWFSAMALSSAATALMTTCLPASRSRACTSSCSITDTIADCICCNTLKRSRRACLTSCARSVAQRASSCAGRTSGRNALHVIESRESTRGPR